MEKLLSFRVDEHLRDEFKLAAAFRRTPMGDILKKAVVKFVDETLTEMEVKTKNGRKSR